MIGCSIFNQEIFTISYSYSFLFYFGLCRVLWCLYKCLLFGLGELWYFGHCYWGFGYCSFYSWSSLFCSHLQQLYLSYRDFFHFHPSLPSFLSNRKFVSLFLSYLTVLCHLPFFFFNSLPPFLYWKLPLKATMAMKGVM